MGWSSIIHLLALFWVVLHILHRVWGGGSETPDMLPTSTTSSRRKLARRHWKYELRHIYLRIETTFLNDWHDRLTQTFVRARFKLWRRSVLAFYDFGIFVALLGQLFGILFLVYLPIRLLSAQLSGSPRNTASASGIVALNKRDTPLETGAGQTGQELPIHFIVSRLQFTLHLFHFLAVTERLLSCQV